MLKPYYSGDGLGQPLI